MRTPHRASLIACALAALATPALAQDPLSADDMTVSGRWGLPTAAGTSLAGRLRVRAVPLSTTVMQAVAPVTPPRLNRRALPVSPQEQAQAAWASAVERSFTNHGYVAPGDAAGASPVIVEVESLSLTPDETGLVAVSRLTVRPAEATGPACLARQVDGRFHALRRAESGMGQRIFAVVAGVGLAAVGAPAAGGSLMVSQFQAASADNAARNSARPSSDQEAVAPEYGDEALTRFATVNAQRLALMGYLRWLGESRPCEASIAAVAPAEAPGATAPPTS